MKTGSVRALALVATLATLAGACEGGGGDRRFLSLGTGGTGGLYYPLGGALASRLSAADPARTWTAEVTGGSVENINRVLSGEMDMGFAIGPSIHEAWQGGGERLRIVAPLYPNLTHVLLGARGGIADVAALRGRRVSVGAGGSGTEQVARDVLLAAGLDSTAYTARYLSFSESAAALADGAIDGAIFSVGIPASAVLEAVTTGAARLVPMDASTIAAMQAAQTYYRPSQIAAGTYPRQAEPLPTIAVFNWIVARDDLPDEIVERLLDLLREDRDALQRSVDVAGQIDVQRLREAPIPLHPAATAWLEANAGG